ncbi:S-layer homology domain-containing protein [Paenibacillus sp. y28]|uniref:S-layer homology domain-containing protein n=1 Tax=Paenibacillus sp. y28 TaxID=3129110 RepID=UPI003019A96F
MQTDWYAGPIAAAVQYGLLGGYEDGSVRPNQAITREEAMVLLLRAMKVMNMDTSLAAGELQPLLEAFPDSDSLQGWSQTAAGISIKYGLMDGMHGEIVPDKPMTRGQLAAVIVRLLEAGGRM